jgi:hypothetical protein
VKKVLNSRPTKLQNSFTSLLFHSVLLLPHLSLSSLRIVPARQKIHLPRKHTRTHITMSAPNTNNTAPAAKPSTSSSVPKWGEPGFVAVDGARYGEDGFVPCGRPGHSGARAKIRHTADQCRRAIPRPSTTNRMVTRQPAYVPSYPALGYSYHQQQFGYRQQNNIPGTGQQYPFPGYGPQTQTPGYGPQNHLLGYGPQNHFPGYGQPNPYSGFGQQQTSAPAISNASLYQGPATVATAEQQIRDLQLQLAQQQQQQQPPPGLPRRLGPSTAAQRNGVKKNQKRGARKQWQPFTRRDGNSGPGGNGSAGAGGSAQA